MIISLRHKDNNLTKQAKIGFSWTVFFFGWIVPFVRGDSKWGVIMLLLSFVTAGISNWVFVFIYNKIYLNELFEQGYIPADNFSILALEKKGMMVTRSNSNYE